MRNMRRTIRNKGILRSMRNARRNIHNLPRKMRKGPSMRQHGAHQGACASAGILEIRENPPDSAGIPEIRETPPNSAELPEMRADMSTYFVRALLYGLPWA